MRRANDQIFQLSLTEIAFMLAFILLLLLGYMLVQADEHANQLEETLVESGNIASNTRNLEKAREELAEALSRAGAKPDDVISALVSQAKLIEERDALKTRVEDLDEQLSALTEVKKTLDAAHGGAGGADVVQKEISQALALKEKLQEQIAREDAAQPANAGSTAVASRSSVKHPDVTAETLSGLVLKAQIQKQLRDQLGASYVPGDESSLAHDLVAAKMQVDAASKSGGSFASVKKENADLRGQVAFLKGRLDARGGRDYPPCWADETTGKAEFLLTIEIGPDGLRVTPAWPNKRQADALALPGIDRLTSTKPQSLADFSASMQGLDRDSKAKNCRHYVYIKNRVTDLDSFNKSRYAIENFFYKLELRR
ncbi:hypothetical protein PQR29_03200 [Paraburkholderia strydomiana]|uniref:hypothetical protein n=1 Tax=Paraburkholderia strydomiana TaxID=1245417 RepID=UPI0038BA3CD1